MGTVVSVIAWQQNGSWFNHQIDCGTFVFGVCVLFPQLALPPPGARHSTNKNLFMFFVYVRCRQVTACRCHLLNSGALTDTYSAHELWTHVCVWSPSCIYTSVHPPELTGSWRFSFLYFLTFYFAFAPPGCRCLLISVAFYFEVFNLIQHGPLKWGE